MGLFLNLILYNLLVINRDYLFLFKHTCYNLSGEIMRYEVDGISYEVKIIKKHIKHLYLRFKDGIININMPVYMSNNKINQILDENTTTLRKMIKHYHKKQTNTFLGNDIDIIAISNLKYPEYENGKLYIKDKNKLDQALKYLSEPIFLKRLDYIYNLFEESIPYPTLKIRKMTSRWGVCNRKNITITLNSDLIKFDYRHIDYVIIHELSHFIHFNHSKSFWELVSKYCPEYKILRKSLRE